jgi:nitrogen regulatory protein PII
LYPIKLSSITERQIKTFYDLRHASEKKTKQTFYVKNLMEFMTTKPALQKILKRILHTEKRNHKNGQKNKVYFRSIENQIRIKKGSNTTKTTK